MELNLTNPSLRSEFIAVCLIGFFIGSGLKIYLLGQKELVEFSLRLFSTSALIALGYVTAKKAQYEYKDPDLSLIKAELSYPYSKDLGENTQEVTGDPQVNLELENTGNGYLSGLEGTVSVNVEISEKDSVRSVKTWLIRHTSKMDDKRVYPGKNLYLTIQLDKFDYEGQNLQQLMNSDDYKVRFMAVKASFESTTSDIRIGRSQIYPSGTSFSNTQQYIRDVR